MTPGPGPQPPRLSAGVIVSGSAIFDRLDPAGNLDLLTREPLRPVRPAAGRTPEEVPDGKR